MMISSTTDVHDLSLQRQTSWSRSGEHMTGSLRKRSADTSWWENMSFQWCTLVCTLPLFVLEENEQKKNKKGKTDSLLGMELFIMITFYSLGKCKKMWNIPTLGLEFFHHQQFFSAFAWDFQILLEKYYLPHISGEIKSAQAFCWSFSEMERRMRQPLFCFQWDNHSCVFSFPSPPQPPPQHSTDSSNTPIPHPLPSTINHVMVYVLICAERCRGCRMWLGQQTASFCAVLLMTKHSRSGSSPQ